MRMRIKKGSILGIWVIGILLMQLVHFSYPDSNQYSSIKISVENIYPQIIYPGDNFDLYLRVMNEGSESTYVKDVVLNLPEGFKLLSRNPLKIERKICGGCSLQIHYILHVDHSVIPGEYIIEENMITPSAHIKESFPLTVYGEDNLLLKILSSQGKINGEGLIKIKLVNNGDNDLKDIKIFLADPIVHFKNTSYVYIPLLKKGQVKSLVIPIVIDKTAEEGIYNSYFNISYRGKKTHSKQYAFSTNILANPEIIVSSISLSQDPIIKERNNIIIRVENSGYGKAKNIKVSISGNFNSLQKEIYLGNLDSEEDASAIFNIVPLNTTNHFHYVVSYKIGNETKTLEGDYTFYANKQSHRNLWIFLGIVVLILLYYLYKKVRSNKEEEHE